MESYLNGKSICNTETMKFAATGSVVDAIGKGKFAGFDFFSIGNERRLLRLKKAGSARLFKRELKRMIRNHKQSMAVLNVD